MAELLTFDALAALLALTALEIGRGDARTNNRPRNGNVARWRW